MNLLVWFINIQTKAHHIILQFYNEVTQMKLSWRHSRQITALRYQKNHQKNAEHNCAITQNSMKSKHTIIHQHTSACLTLLQDKITNNIKRDSSPKNVNSVIIIYLFQTFISFFPPLNTKERHFEEYCNHWLPQC